jgi:hypothetical protein
MAKIPVIGIESFPSILTSRAVTLHVESFGGDNGLPRVGIISGMPEIYLSLRQSM